ncbi:MAG TPA: dihydrofolate reductase family protein, partial [Micromonosporaceae bacterium]
DVRIASLMNRLPKIVVSTTLRHADWAGTTVVSDLDKLAAIKPEAGGDIIIMGSSNLTVNLIEAGILDEARIMIHPIVLGAGRSLFCTARRRIGLELLSTRTFASGSVLLTYRPS